MNRILVINDVYDFPNQSDINTGKNDKKYPRPFRGGEGPIERSTRLQV